VAHRRLPGGRGVEEVPSTGLDLGDECVVGAGEVIPSDGEVIEGIASVDESAITGESAPVIGESGGDRSAVTGGTRVLSDRIVVRITARAGETFIDRMIALVEGSERKKTPNEIALNILLAGLTIIFLLATVTLQPFAIYAHAEQSVVVLVALLVCLIPTTIGGLLSAIGIAMLIGRFFLIIPVLGIAGSMARKQQLPATAGTFPTHTPLFVVLVIGVILVVGALTFLPALALGPIVEQLKILH
jgi:P-type E1-E2 ATPase